MLVYAHDPTEDPHALYKWQALFEGDYSYPGLDFPVRFYEHADLCNKKKRDFLCNDIGDPMLITDGFKAKLEAHQITGWQTYPIVLIDRHGQAITTPKYHGFSVVGRCGPRDMEEIMQKEEEKGGWRTGISLDPATWDGSDIFLEKDIWFHTFISKRAAKVFAKQNVFDIEPISQAKTCDVIEDVYEKMKQGYHKPKYASPWVKKDG